MDIKHCRGLEEITSYNYKLQAPGYKSIYVNLYRNEIQEPNLSSLFNKVLHGYYVNTLGDKNINKISKSF